ncbi:MAG: hypothetical protein J7D61_17125, partial [Marichromatium sp.]|nr:hypothetical protein [Marichromatium sp.]
MSIEQADLIEKRLGIADGALLSRREPKAQGNSLGIAEQQVDLGRQAAATAPERMAQRLLRLFFPPPAVARVARIEVESII